VEVDSAEDRLVADVRITKSPCIDVCVMDEASGLCTGCLRTLEEIATWASASDAERRATLKAIAVRRRHRRSIAE